MLFFTCEASTGCLFSMDLSLRTTLHAREYTRAWEGLLYIKDSQPM